MDPITPAPESDDGDWGALVEIALGMAPDADAAPVVSAAPVAPPDPVIAPVAAVLSAPFDPTTLYNPDLYFTGRDLQLEVAVFAVLRLGAVGRGIDGRLWVWVNGVWREGDREIHERVVDLLGTKFGVGHLQRIVSYLMGKRELPMIESTPVPEYINVRNGLYDWHAGTLYSHSPAVLSTVQLAVDWNPAATCPSFLEFLHQVVDPDAIDFMQELMGYLVYSGNPFEKAIMLYGGGRNGKGVFLKVLESLLGAESIAAVTLQDLAGANRFAKADLFGKLANIAGDLDSTKIKSTGEFKSIVGNDVVRAEFKGTNAFKFNPFVTNVFAANKIPASVDTTTGYLDRWIVVKFPNTFAGKSDSTLKSRLTQPAELEGVLVWAMTGLRRLMARGRVDLPASVQAAMGEFAIAIDPVRGFLKECAVHDLAGRTNRRDVYPVYQAWSTEQGVTHTMTKQEFNAQLLTIPGIGHVLRDGDTLFSGFTLTKRAIDFIAPGSGF